MKTDIKSLLEFAGVDTSKGKAKQLVENQIHPVIQQLIRQHGNDVAENYGNDYQISLGGGLGEDVLDEIRMLQGAGLKDGQDFEFAGSHGHDDDMTNDLITVSVAALDNQTMQQFLDDNAGPITDGPDDQEDDEDEDY